MRFRIQHPHTLKNRLLTAFLVAMAWLASGCVVMEPSHACCKEAMDRLSATLPACCTGHVFIPPADQQTGHGFDPGPWISQNHFELRHFLNAAMTEDYQSAVASAHVPDQSGRYLELRILLN
jgi:hypothetical protein